MPRAHHEEETRTRLTPATCGEGRRPELGGARVSAALSSKGGTRVGKVGTGGCRCLNRSRGRTSNDAKKLGEGGGRMRMELLRI
jgi:hypothetical protein